ncbi:MAG: glycosyl transferase, group 1, partial [Acidobacteria bacterium]|nr:glycosyl transferase, group 1 [Acidobacteriota bacterium]
MTRKTKICFVLPSLAGGGAERVAVDILNALDPSQWDRAMYLSSREGPYLELLDPSIRLTSGSRRSRRGRWLDLRRYLRAERPELVVSFLSYFSTVSATKAAGIGARVVFNQGTPTTAFLADRDYDWRHGWHRRLFSLATRVGYRLADAIVTTSKGVADDLVASFAVPRERIRIVHNPVDLVAIASGSAEPLEAVHERAWSRPAIVAAGRLADAKNYPLLIDAFDALRRSIPARLFILGHGDREPQLRAQIAQLGLGDHIVLCGFQQNPWKYIARADVFAMSSAYEGFGNVLVEAMACGVPVAAYPVEGPVDVVGNGRSGMLNDDLRQACL